jgi:hypothetical protein
MNSVTCEANKEVIRVRHVYASFVVTEVTPAMSQRTRCGMIAQEPQTKFSRLRKQKTTEMIRETQIQ